MRPQTVKAEIVKELLQKHPDLPSLQLSRIARKKYPNTFLSIEDARNIIRYYIGTHGNKNRKNIQPAQIRPPEIGEIFRKNPFGFPKSHADKWRPMPFPVKKGRGLIIADLHIPYHDIQAMTLTFTWGKENSYSDFILVDGDLQDCYQLSRFQRFPDKRGFRKELDDVNVFLDALQKAFPNAVIILKKGNHDNRHETYLLQKAPELFDMADWSWENYLHIEKRGIITVAHDVPLTVGKLNILHGHELNGTQTAVNPARGAYLKALDCILVAHNHRSSQHTETSLSRRQDSSWSVGCLCCLWPEFARINKWNHGFAAMEVSGYDFEIENKRIVQGEVVR
jgi:predicted phosphodiesterase